MIKYNGQSSLNLWNKKAQFSTYWCEDGRYYCILRNEISNCQTINNVNLSIYVPGYVLNDYLWVYDGGGAIYDSVSYVSSS